MATGGRWTSINPNTSATKLKESTSALTIPGKWSSNTDTQSQYSGYVRGGDADSAYSGSSGISRQTNIPTMKRIDESRQQKETFWLSSTSKMTDTYATNDNNSVKLSQNVNKQTTLPKYSNPLFKRKIKVSQGPPVLSNIADTSLQDTKAPFALQQRELNSDPIKIKEPSVQTKNEKKTTSKKKIPKKWLSWMIM